MLGKGLAVHLEQRLRHGLCNGPQAGSEPACENRNRRQWIQQGVLLRMCHNCGSGKVKLHTNLAKSGASHDCAKASLLFRIEHEKSTSAGAYEFAAERSIGSREFI